MDIGFEAVFSLAEVYLKQVYLFLSFYLLPKFLSFVLGKISVIFHGRERNPFSIFEAVYGCFLLTVSQKSKDQPEYFYVIMIIILIFQE